MLESKKTNMIADNLELAEIFSFFSPGVVFGSPPVPKDCLVSISYAEGFYGKKESPLFHEPDQNINVFDCAKIFFDPKNARVREHKDFLRLKINNNQNLTIGDRVMAIGYPGVMGIKNLSPETVPCFQEGLYGAIGVVTDLYPQGRCNSRPWPSFEVSCKWPSGISGGPIFNEAGHVIGLVSSSTYDPAIKGTTSGYSFWFEKISLLKTWLPHIDPDNTGNIRGWGVIRLSPWHIAGIFDTPQEASALKEKLGAEYEVKYGSNTPGTDNFIL